MYCLLVRCHFCLVIPGEGEAKECKRKPPSPVPGHLPLPAFSLATIQKRIFANVHTFRLNNA